MLKVRLHVNFEFRKYRSEWGETDGYAIIGDGDLLLLEVERSQNHATTNILKVWPLLKSKPTIRIILVHAFFVNSRGLTGSRRLLSDWIADKMKASELGRFSYCRLDVDEERNRVSGIGALRAAYHRLKSGDPL